MSCDTEENMKNNSLAAWLRQEFVLLRRHGNDQHECEVSEIKATLADTCVRCNSAQTARLWCAINGGN